MKCYLFLALFCIGALCGRVTGVHYPEATWTALPVGVLGALLSMLADMFTTEPR